MKDFLIIILLFVFTSNFGQIARGNTNQNNSSSTENSSELPQLPKEDNRFKTKKKVADCNKDLELEQSNNLIYHKRTRKPFTGTCVSYFDNQQMERMVSFLMGKENGTSYTYYQNGQVMVMTIYCLLYTSPSPRDVEESRMPSSA